VAERWSQTGEPAGIGGEVEFRTEVFDAASIQTRRGGYAGLLVAHDR